jgi:hypothetical protein
VVEHLDLRNAIHIGHSEESGDRLIYSPQAVADAVRA